MTLKAWKYELSISITLNCNIVSIVQWLGHKIFLGHWEIFMTKAYTICIICHIYVSCITNYRWFYIFIGDKAAKDNASNSSPTF